VEIKNLVDFEALKPKPLMELFGVDLGSLDTKNLKGQYAVYMDTYLIYAIILALCIFFLLLAFVIGVVFKKFKETIFEKISSLKEKLIWNGIIQSISIAYLN